MEAYSLEALGQVVRDAREEKGITQNELGQGAGYKGGAGVTISRLESGQLRPPPQRLVEIARVLDLSPSQLVSLAEARTNDSQDGNLEERVAEISRESSSRTKLITILEELDSAHDRARDSFLLRFREIATRVDGREAASPTPLVLGDHETTGDAAAEVQYQILFTRLGVAKALAAPVEGKTAIVAKDGDEYSSFTEGVRLGTVATGVTVLTQTTDPAALNGFGAAMRIGHSAGAGEVAADIAVRIGKVAGTLLGKLSASAARNRKRQLELAAEADEVAAAMTSTQPGILAVRELAPRATEVLDYIAIHAGHALARWEAQIGPGPVEWNSLSPELQRRYEDFVEITAAQLTVATVSPSGLMILRGEDLERAKAMADQLLTQSRQIVTSYV